MVIALQGRTGTIRRFQIAALPAQPGGDQVTLEHLPFVLRPQGQARFRLLAGAVRSCGSRHTIVHRRLGFVDGFASPFHAGTQKMRRT